MEEPCDYCGLEIDTDTWGWGYLYDEYGQSNFHLECLELYDDVQLA